MKLITCSVYATICMNSVHSATRGIGQLVSSRAYSSLSNIESISPRIMMATFNGNPNTTIISCYSPINVIEELEV